MQLSKTRSHQGDKESIAHPQRRQFLQKLSLGAGLLTTIGIASCSKDKDSSPSMGVSLGSGDFAVLNYAYALEQLEAAFYTQVVATPYSGISTGELKLLTDIRDHEIGHREFFKAALATAAIPTLTIDFSKIDFTKRDVVLKTAQTFEDLGVAAYNGAGNFIADEKYLALAGKIVSVEARHAAYLRDLVTPGSFSSGSDIVDANGINLSMTPAAVFAAAGAYIKTQIDTNTLPK
ncbi:ferritin-like domain-containing protein [Chitinophaga sp. sic0106]|uniref:ferritin-like domain-containing protein n=1 Tax=Chitinophaga sp. sic0106 TaxID=2854785 RepID=UPI001C497A47|nr:ferritin-like domain-containing protein [Chitinophaga sp. sic0106]MBV7528584.1 ferritin-like domain-containing protein [Chitinophaga sp. sic0106]